VLFLFGVDKMKRNYQLDAMLALNDARRRDFPFLHNPTVNDLPKLTETFVETIKGKQFIGTAKQLELYKEYFGVV
jgi:hypothetical protein